MTLLPNFLIVGAPKAGTTTLWEWLRQHPEIFMSEKKETHFLIYNCKVPVAKDVGPDPVTSYDDYVKLFENAAGKTAIGEASPGYLCDPDVPHEINRVLPGAKSIAILRDPVERAWSSYCKAILLREETEKRNGFLAALESEPVHSPDPWDGGRRLVRMGLYSEQLQRYQKVLGADRVQIHLYEDLATDPVGMLDKCHKFLCVSSSFRTDTKVRRNRTVIPRSKSLHRLLARDSRLRRSAKRILPQEFRDLIRRPVNSFFELNLAQKPKIPRSIRRSALRFFVDDIKATQDIIHRDLRHWLKG